jgi:hypothetical protein
MDIKTTINPNNLDREITININPADLDNMCTAINNLISNTYTEFYISDYQYDLLSYLVETIEQQERDLIRTGNTESN